MEDTFLDLAQRRRSIRKFTAQPVEQEKVQKLMQVALLAPSGKRLTPWQFVLVTDAEMLQKMSEMRPMGSQLLAGAPLAIVVLADTTKTDVWVEDTSISASYIQLEAENLGLGSCWVQVRGRMKDENLSTEDYLRALLDIPAHYSVENVIAVGYKVEVKFPHDLQSLPYDKIHNEKFHASAEEKLEESKNVLQPQTSALAADDKTFSHTQNKRILWGSAFILIGLLVLLRRILPDNVGDVIFSIRSYFIYAGLLFVALKKFSPTNQKTGIVLIAIGLILWLLRGFELLDIWNFWFEFYDFLPLFFVLIGAIIVLFVLNDRRRQK